MVGRAQVRTGLDELIASDWKLLAGRRVGLITNQTGVTLKGELGASLMAHAKAFTLAAIYAPEHGLAGTRPAGVASDARETFEGVPVYSLYGSTRRPTKAMLRGVDLLVFDIQDVGVRPYTFVSTMLLSMEVAAAQHLPFIVLDRPDPLGGERIEGSIVKPDLISFVGQAPVPYIHGMTLGELARMAKAKGWFAKADQLRLTVVPMHGWKRSMCWSATGRVWVAPSPNVPRFENAVGLAMLGAIGELGVLSVGIGSDLPFLRFGTTLIPSEAMPNLTQDLWRTTSTVLDSLLNSGGLPFALHVEEYTATTSAGTKTYHGCRMELPRWRDRDVYREMPEAIEELYTPQFRLLEAVLHDTGVRTSYDAVPFSSQRMFEKVTGLHGLYDSLRRCEDLAPIFEEWRTECAAFRKERAPYLLYKN